MRNLTVGPRAEARLFRALCFNGRTADCSTENGMKRHYLGCVLQPPNGPSAKFATDRRHLRFVEAHDDKTT